LTIIAIIVCAGTNYARTIAGNGLLDVHHRLFSSKTMDIPFRFSDHSVTSSPSNTKKPWLVISTMTESNFGADRDDESDDHRHGRATKQQNVLWQELDVTRAVAKASEELSFDACREYGYRYEYADFTNGGHEGDGEDDDDDDDDENDHGKSPKRRASKTVQVTTTKNNGTLRLNGKSLPPMIYYYVLGKIYHPAFNADERREDESSLFWFTYRCDFYEIAPYRITTDAGWGCMLRSAQMLLGQALRLHFKGRDWKPPTDLTQRRKDDFVQDILTWFADFPSTNTCRFSLHNMVAAGMAKYEILPGEWYGPSTACYVLRDLAQLFEQEQQQQQSSSSAKQDRSKIFRIHVAAQGTVYRNEIHRLMTTQHAEQPQQQETTKEPVEKHAAQESLESSQPLFHPLDPAYNHDSPANEKVNYDVEWDTSLLLLIPLRLGLKSFHSDYVQSLAFSFSLPQSVGVLGGRPRGARWFYGATSDGSRVLGLDPHTIQSAPELIRADNARSRQQLKVDLTDEYLQSIHTSFPEVFSLSKMDPSIALGFYCQNNAALEHLMQAFEQWKHNHSTLPELFTVAKTTPDYMATSSQLSDTMTLSVSSSIDHQVASISLLDDIVGEDDNDDNDSHASDEYVML
jgi:cysteine protease ATG4